MANTKTFLGKQAARLTALHFIHEFRSKAKRQPFRSVTLLSAGALIGVVVGGTAGWLAGRNNNDEPG